MSKKQNKTTIKRILRRKENLINETAPTHDVMRGCVARRNWGGGQVSK